MEASLIFISYIVSLITIGLCFFLKVPQILNLYESKTAGSLSLHGLLLELTSYSVMTCYNYVNGYSLLTYLEYPIILLQELVLIYLVLFYRGLINKLSLMLGGVYVTVFLSLLCGIVPSPVLSLIAPFCTSFSTSSKVMQILAIVKSGTSQGVSMTTWFISAFTNLSRAFTVYLDSGDMFLLTNFSISTFLSSIVMHTIDAYDTKKSQGASLNKLKLEKSNSAKEE